MQLRENADLRAFNTLRVAATARYLVILGNREDALRFARDHRFRDLPRLAIGSGSNVLFRRDFDGVVAVMASRGVQTTEIGDSIEVEAAAGEDWHGLVKWTLASGSNGLENLSLIPGTVGAAPVQNIGAYGVELSDRFVSLEAVDLDSGTLRQFGAGECGFGYRTSIFKLDARDRFLICSVKLRLDRALRPTLHYAGVREELERLGAQPLTALAISAAICSIRSRKVPDPRALGNAGSFFKNPEITTELAESLASRFPGLPVYPRDDGRAKVSAAWLIEQCGWKGKRQGDAGVYAEHALVLVNHGTASGMDLWALAMAIRDSVGERFGIELEPEPRIV